MLPVSQSSSHHASNPITTFHWRVNSQELNYQHDEITEMTMTISLHPNCDGVLQVAFCECLSVYKDAERVNSSSTTNAFWEANYL